MGCAGASPPRLSHTRPGWHRERRRGGTDRAAALRRHRSGEKGRPMTPMKTLPEREKELQFLLATPAGRAELQALESRYLAAGGAVWAASAVPLPSTFCYDEE